ncbi:cytochrome P450, partial [Melanogaster broomeanus]
IEKYGPVITPTNGEDVHAIIGWHQEYEAVFLIEKQGAVLAERPYSIASNEILSRGLKFMQMSTCDRFRMYPKAAHSELQMKATLIYDNQTQYARNIVLDILKEPESHQGHIKRFSATMTLRVIYGKTTPTYLNDSYTLHLQRMVPIVQGALIPGAYKVDKYPFLKYVPGYTWELDKWANSSTNNHTGPYSVAGGLLSKPEMGMSEDEISYFCSSLVAASYDTIKVAISTILLAGGHFPDIQEIVHAESTPSWAAKHVALVHLTKLHAFILESLRWRPVNPLGKSYCWRWALLRTDLQIPDPETFDINHWIDLGGDLSDLKAFSFGFGRRICPGFNLANCAMFLSLATVVWSFTIKEDFSNRYNAFELPAAIVSPHKPYSMLYQPRTHVGWLKDVMSGQMDKSVV